MINSFDKEYYFLSNYYPSKITFEGIEYKTVEHAFQAAKSLDNFERYSIAIMPTPGRAKQMGRSTSLRADWEEVKESVMETCLREKFAIPELREKLLTTGDEELIEGNTWHDNTWGDCTCAGCADNPGRNLLGKLLMKIREELK